MTVLHGFRRSDARQFGAQRAQHLLGSGPALVDIVGAIEKAAMFGNGEARGTALGEQLDSGVNA